MVIIIKKIVRHMQSTDTVHIFIDKVFFLVSNIIYERYIDYYEDKNDVRLYYVCRVLLANESDLDF